MSRVHAFGLFAWCAYNSLYASLLRVPSQVFVANRRRPFQF